jgi:membrane protein DedA with SNARE-associated domain
MLSNAAYRLKPMLTFAQGAASIVNHVGVAGIGAGVFLNGLGIPGISEVLVPLGGVAVRQGRMDALTLFVVAMTAQLVGVSVAYAIGRYGGLALLEKYGKYVLISAHDLRSAQRAFERYGTRVVIFGSFTPGLQGFLGYIAGVAQMNFPRFLVSVFFGKLVWIGGLIYVGVVLGNNLDLVDRVIKQLGVVILAAILLLGIWYIRRHRNRLAARSYASTQKEQ